MESDLNPDLITLIKTEDDVVIKTEIKEEPTECDELGLEWDPLNGYVPENSSHLDCERDSEEELPLPSQVVIKEEQFSDDEVATNGFSESLVHHEANEATTKNTVSNGLASHRTEAVNANEKSFHTVCPFCEKTTVRVHFSSHHLPRCRMWKKHLGIDKNEESDLEDSESSTVSLDQPEVGQDSTNNTSVDGSAGPTREVDETPFTIQCPFCEKNVRHAFFLSHHLPHCDEWRKNLGRSESQDADALDSSDSGNEASGIDGKSDAFLTNPRSGRHSSSLRYTCEICGKLYKRFNSYRFHVLAHRLETYPCYVCEMKFDAPALRSAHEQTHARGPFKCDECDHSAETLALLRQHLDGHVGVKQYSCAQCNAKLSSKKELDYHTFSHTIAQSTREYLCDKCGKTFNSLSNLFTHMESHAEGRNFVCDICGKGYKSRSLLKNHVRNSHQPENIKDLMCAECDRKFSVRSALLRHIQEFHRSLKPFKCRLCSAQFSRPVKLTEHFRLHTGERPFPCALCDMSYASSAVLNRHKKLIHEGSGRKVKEDSVASTSSTSDDGSDEDYLPPSH